MAKVILFHLLKDGRSYTDFSVVIKQYFPGGVILEPNQRVFGFPGIQSHSHMQFYHRDVLDRRIR